ncbi:MAG: BACON domain-containing protein, partial [Thermoleophilia bacterium]
WLEYEPEPLVRFGATYTVGGEYDPTKGRYGKCLAHGAAFAHDREGECMAAEVTVKIGEVSYVYWPNSYGSAAVVAGVKSKEGDYVLPIESGGCQYATYASANIFFNMRYTKAHPLLYANQQWSGVDRPPVNECITPPAISCMGGGLIFEGPIDSHSWYWSFRAWSDDTLLQLGWEDLEATRGRFSAMQIFTDARTGTFETSNISVMNFHSTISIEDGGPMTPCSSVTYEPAEATIKSGESVTVTPTGDDPLCRGFPIKYGPLINTMAEPRIYNRLATSDGSPPTPIEITVEGECTAVPVSGNAQFSIQGWYGPLVVTPTYEFTFNPLQGSGCMTIPIKTNGAECAWTATSKNEWLVIEEGTETGTGDGRINVQVAAHTVVTTQEQMAGGRRTGTIEITTDGETPKTVVATIKQG